MGVGLVVGNRWGQEWVVGGIRNGSGWGQESLVGGDRFRCYLHAACVSPVCRLHIVAEFNRGVYDYVIATDEAHGLGIP